ncbi:MAG TPA: tetratricopeptide repeat protein [Zeimonas sp.]
MALVLAALAPMACATEGGPVQGGADLFDEPQGQGTAPASAQADSATPVDPASLQSQAEDAYRMRRFDEAVTLYDRLLALQPSNAHAWLRLGNVHHQRRDWFKALAAYRRVAARSLAGVDTEPSLRAKAIYNTALIDLELARLGLRSLERLGEAALDAADPAPLAREIDRTQRRLEALSTSEPVARPAPAPRVGGHGAARAPARRGDELPKVDYIRGEPRP